MRASEAPGFSRGERHDKNCLLARRNAPYSDLWVVTGDDKPCAFGTKGDTVDRNGRSCNFWIDWLVFEIYDKRSFYDFPPPNRSILVSLSHASPLSAKLKT